MMAAAPAILVLAPMPAAPASAGNRRRLVATCETLMRGGFSVDLAYYAHEDQIYRRFGQHPPTDLAAMADRVRNLFLIEAHSVIPLKTRAPCFGIDAWCPAEVGDFVAWYVAQFPDTRAVLANYIFLSGALERVPPGVLRLIDTHDRFSGRQTQYRPFRAEPNFFYTDDAGEAAGLARADVVLAIQAAEARAFAGLAAAEVLLLPPVFPAERAFAPPGRVARIGFLGHGNDPNLFSIGRFAQAWGQGWTPERPELVIAGEICRSLEGIDGPGVRRLGYLDRLSDFYDQADLVVAPMLMGSGLKMKVGEALSYGRAVIGTEIGLEGFEPEHPAHRCRDVEAVKAAVLAVVADREALTGLTRASEALFVRYAAIAAAAEARLIARLQAQAPPAARVEGGHRPTVAPQAAPAVARVTASGGGLVLTAEPSARSLPAADPDLGVLVATERRPGDGTAASYRPERRRWFARADAAASGPVPDLGALDLALAPEWVRDRTLAAPARAALTRAFAAMNADFETTGRVVGRAGDRLEVATLLPGVLAAGSHPSALFLIGAEAATELRLERVTRLQLRPPAPYADRTGRLPAPVPASLALRAAGDLPAGGGQILLLTDDGIGRIVLDEEARP